MNIIMQSVKSFILKIQFLLLISILLISCQNSKPLHFTVENSNNFSVENKVFVIERDFVESISDNLELNDFVVFTCENQQLPAQFDDLDQDGKWDEIALSISLNANSNCKVTFRIIDKTDLPIFPTFTDVHFGVKSTKNQPAQSVESFTLYGTDLPWDDDFYPFQMDGPAWENDKVGFRIYLDGRNAKDIFGKRTNKLVLANTGLDETGTPVDNYHVLEDWGRDVLQVGNSLGAGGLALFENDSLYRLGIIRDSKTDVVDSTIFQIINTGPIRGIFKLTYFGWNVNGEKHNLEEIISINRGEYCYHAEVKLSNLKDAQKLVIGLSNLNNNQSYKIQEGASKIAIVTHDKQSYEREYFLGTALVVSKENYVSHNQTKENGDGIVSSYYFLAQEKSGEKINYAVYAGWEYANSAFLSKANFHSFIQHKLETKDFIISK